MLNERLGDLYAAAVHKRRQLTQPTAERRTTAPGAGDVQERLNQFRRSLAVSLCDVSGKSDMVRVNDDRSCAFTPFGILLSVFIIRLIVALFNKSAKLGISLL